MNKPKEHALKTWPEFFQAVAEGRKTFEIREDDRGYQVGDVLVLQEYEPTAGTYTGKDHRARITYIFRGGHGSALAARYVILALGEAGPDHVFRRLCIECGRNVPDNLMATNRVCANCSDGGAV